MVHIYSKDDLIDQFTIGYTINPSLHVNKVFREQVEKFLNATFHEKIMKNIRNILKNKNTCVIALIIFYENKLIKPKKLYRVLSCVIYYLMENYICIEYL